MPSPGATRQIVRQALDVRSTRAASGNVTNTTAETQFDSITATMAIPANTIVAGTIMKVRFQCIAPSTNATDTLQIRLRLREAAEALSSATLILDSTAVDAVNDDVVMGEAWLEFRTVGPAGTFVAAGLVTVPDPAGTAVVRQQIVASTAVDTTVALTLSVTATWSVANAGNQVRLDVYQVEILRP